MPDQPAPFREIALLGPGLLGASLALALKSSARIRLWGRRAESIADSRQRGIAAVCTTNLAEAVEGADLVIFCVPIEACAEIARQIAPRLSPAALVTDVGSVKAPVVAELEPIFGPERFLGSHPMAGSEQSGSASARADLFAGAACILTPSARTPAALLERISAFWQRLQCEIYQLPPEEHDRQVALISHLPHLLAACAVHAVAASDEGAFPLAGQGFRDTTRIASGPPAMWSGILQGNRREILSSLQSLQGQLCHAQDLLEKNDAAGLRNFLAAAKTKRDGLSSKLSSKIRYGGN